MIGPIVVRLALTVIKLRYCYAVSAIAVACQVVLLHERRRTKNSMDCGLDRSRAVAVDDLDDVKSGGMRQLDVLLGCDRCLRRGHTVKIDIDVRRLYRRARSRPVHSAGAEIASAAFSGTHQFAPRTRDNAAATASSSSGNTVRGSSSSSSS